MNVNVTVNMIKERDQGNGKIATQKKELKENKRLMDRVKVVNSYDINLYNTGNQY